MRDLALTEGRLNEAQRIARIGSWTWDLTNDTHWWSDELYRMLQLDRETETRPYDRFRALVKSPRSQPPGSDPRTDLCRRKGRARRSARDLARWHRANH